MRFEFFFHRLFICLFAFIVCDICRDRVNTIAGSFRYIHILQLQLQYALWCGVVVDVTVRAQCTRDWLNWQLVSYLNVLIVVHIHELMWTQFFYFRNRLHSWEFTFPIAMNARKWPHADFSIVQLNKLDCVDRSFGRFALESSSSDFRWIYIFYSCY